MTRPFNTRQDRQPHHRILKGIEFTEVLIGLRIWAIIGSLIGVVILCAAAKWVIKQSVPFDNAYATVFFAYLINGLSGLAAGYILGAAVPSADVARWAGIPLTPVGFLIQSGIIAVRLKVNYRMACLVTLVKIGIIVGVAIMAGGLIFIIAKLASLG